MDGPIEKEAAKPAPVDVDALYHKMDDDWTDRLIHSFDGQPEKNLGQADQPASSPPNPTPR